MIVDNLKDKQDEFEYWVADMEDNLKSFMGTLPQETSNNLDFSIGSLDILENYILNKFGSIKMLDSRNHDSLARYIGETYKSHLNTAIWDIQLEDREKAFYGLPILTGDEKLISIVCPHALVTATIDRRKGTFLKTILENIIKK